MIKNKFRYTKTFPTMYKSRADSEQSSMWALST